MREDYVLVDKKGPLTLLGLNRPNKLNALNPQMLEALALTLEEADQDEDVRVVIIHGVGRAFAYLEGVADAETIDKAMRLGVNYPYGPPDWGKHIGYSKVLSVLDHLYAEYHEERYRACTLLRRWARQEH